jgi:hypothetical protein
MKDKIMNLTAIKTNKGFYVTDQVDSNYGTTGLPCYFFDGQNPKATFHRNWVLISSAPQKIEGLKRQPSINHRYELIDETMVNDKIKLKFKRDEVTYVDDCERFWKDEYSHLSSLYRYVEDEQPDIKEEIEFKFDVVLELEKIERHKDFSYSVLKDSGWSHQEVAELKSEKVTYQLIDKIVFPDIVLPSRPSKFTSKQSFEIVRQHIKENINPKVAEITSDYDFCFTVKKKIPFAEPHKYEVDINFFHKRRKPKYETRFKANRFVEIFEMTHSPKSYGGYTPICGFTGENHTDLKKKIDNYLKGLMEYINEPVKDCAACKGDGVIIDKALSPKTENSEAK